MDQKSRTETLDKFRGGNLKLLIASDVAARGLDIPAVSHVFNFDVPTHAEDYIHRIGRTGRAGRSGTSITLAAPSDGKYLDAILKLIQRDIPLMTLDKSAASEDAVNDSEPAEQARSPRQDRGRRGRSNRGGERPHQVAAAAEPSAPKPHAEPAAPRPRPEAPRPQRQPVREAQPRPNTARPPREKADSDGSPFGTEGPIPAFLLRPATRSN